MASVQPSIAPSNNRLLFSEPIDFKPLKPAFPSKPIVKTTPNFATAVSNIDFFYNGPTASSTLTSAESQVLVQGNGIATAIADAAATFQEEPNFSSLFTLNGVVGEEGAYNSISRSEAQVIGAFSLKANEKFSFSFSAFEDLLSKEIRNRDREYAYAGQNTSFVVLDISNPYRTRVVDYFAMNGKLESGRYIGRQRLGRSRNVKVVSQEKARNIGGNDGIDGLTRIVEGQYNRSFSRDTRLAVVEVVNSYTEVIGDTLLGNLGPGVTYGTIRNDYLYANYRGGRVYASFGNDRLFGSDRNDILEGSFGNDRLKGRRGNDKLHGGFDNDILQGGRGSDVLVGGEGKDTFIFRSSEFKSQERDIIADFEVGVDKLEFSGWRSRDITQEARISTTRDGATLSFKRGGAIVFQGLSADDLKKALPTSRGASASFQDGQDTLLRPRTQTSLVGYDSVSRFKQDPAIAQQFNLPAPRPQANAVKLDDAALVQGIKLEQDKVQFTADIQDYSLQYVQGSNKPRGTSITYQGSGDLTGASIQGNVGVDTFSSQVFQ